MPSGKNKTQVIEIMRKAFFYLFALFSVFQLSFGAETPFGRTEKAVYAPGEPIRFLFDTDFGADVPETEYYSLKWTRIGDDGKQESGIEKIPKGGTAVVSTRLNQPGFVQLQALLLNDRGKLVKRKNANGKKRTVKFEGGVGVEPEKLMPGTEELFEKGIVTAYLDAFWEKQKKRLAAVPVHAEMTKIKTTEENADFDIYAVSVNCAGPRPVTGYLAIPAGAAEKSLSACVNFQGYGISVQTPPKGLWNANQIYFEVNAHGYDLGKDRSYYSSFFDKTYSNGRSYGFDPLQNADPEKAYFNGMALRVMRALQFIRTLPQWNGQDLTASGGSQGGMQALWAGSLDPSVSEVVANIPWCCDLGGKRAGRLGGWRPEYVPALGYYDSVFHGRRIHCPVTIPRASLGDEVCPPSGVALLYYNLGTRKKKILVYPNSQTFIWETK